MTRKHVQFVTGLAVDLLTRPSGVFALGYRDDSGAIPSAVGIGHTSEAALAALLATNWGKLQRQVSKEQGYRCAHCGRARPLGLHHIVFRSKTRNDRRENLEALCAECHRAKHERRHRKLRACDSFEEESQAEPERRTIYDAEPASHFVLHLRRTGVGQEET